MTSKHPLRLAGAALLGATLVVAAVGPTTATTGGRSRQELPARTRSFDMVRV